MNGQIRVWAWMSALAMMLASGSAAAQSLPRRILLIPLDDRPVSTQMPEMMASIAGVTVETPPRFMLGRFDRPGDPDAILAWLREGGRIGKYDAILVSSDMLCYGGLIASRSPVGLYEDGLRRLRSFWSLRLDSPQTRVYGFSSIMRLAPTAVKGSGPWRLKLARYIQLREEQRLKPTKALAKRLADLVEILPADEIRRYDAARQRNVRLHRDILQMTALGAFDHIVFGQDDAAPTGPHVRETKALIGTAKEFQVDRRTTFIQGIDQVASVILARAISNGVGQKPRIRAIFSDDSARQKTAFYEAAPIEQSLNQQIVASGAVWSKDENISLFVNTPKPTDVQVSRLGLLLRQSLDAGRMTAVADINLGHSGTPDPRLMDQIMSPTVFHRLCGFAGWNTAANTMGTTVPASVIYWSAVQAGVDPMQREVQLRRFLFHRMISDWQYHHYTRPLAYGLIAQIPTASKEELSGEAYDQVTDLVKRDLSARTESSFQALLSGTLLATAVGRSRISGLGDLQISLPWPRAYEVSVDFKLDVAPVAETEPHE